MDAVPEGIDLAKIQDFLARRGGVSGVHDLHVWAMSTSEPALTAHLVVREERSGDGILRDAQVVLHERFGIHHITLQLEAEPCAEHCAADKH